MQLSFLIAALIGVTFGHFEYFSVDFTVDFSSEIDFNNFTNEVCDGLYDCICVIEGVLFNSDNIGNVFISDVNLDFRLYG